MNTYTVTAGNRFFWQSLVVVARDRDEAAEKFDTFLAQPSELQAEEEEYELALSDDDLDHSDLDRGDYRYGFDPADIEERDHFPHWRGTPGPQVQRMHADGNG